MFHITSYFHRLLEKVEFIHDTNLNQFFELNIEHIFEFGNLKFLFHKILIFNSKTRNFNTRFTTYFLTHY